MAFSPQKIMKTIPLTGNRFYIPLFTEKLRTTVSIKNTSKNNRLNKKITCHNLHYPTHFLVVPPVQFIVDYHPVHNNPLPSRPQHALAPSFLHPSHPFSFLTSPSAFSLQHIARTTPRLTNLFAGFPACACRPPITTPAQPAFPSHPRLPNRDCAPVETTNNQDFRKAENE